MATWILLRGLTRESGHCGGFLPLFQQTCPDDAVVPLDLPGSGAFHDQASPWTVQAVVQHCRLQLAHMGVKPPFCVLALSNTCIERRAAIVGGVAVYST